MDVREIVDSAAERIAVPRLNGNKKPLLIINSGDLPSTAKELAGYFAADDHFLSNGNAPVVIVTGDDIPRAIPVTADLVRTAAHELCQPVKQIKDKYVDHTLSKDIAQLYLYGLVGEWGLKIFRGITTAPILKDDGSIRMAHGYDAESGLWCHNIPEIEIPERPEEDEAREALGRLRFFFRTFPFADGERIKHGDVEIIDGTKPPGLDESIFLVAVLTAVTRASLLLAPGFLCDAPSLSGAGTGKGMLVKAAAVIGSGICPSAFTSGHDEGEFDKRLTAALTEAHPAIFLDNFNAKGLKSDILASALTENPAMVRTMGQTKNVPLHTRTFICITGNGVQIAEDMARRILKTSLDAKMENPEQRTFDPGFLDSVFAQRPKLLADALTIWRWGRQSDIRRGKPLGNYELWSQWCRDPLLALGCRDPVDRIAEIKAADPQRQALVAFFDIWWTIHADNLIKVGDVDDQINEHADAKSSRKGDGTLIYSKQRVKSYLERHVGTRVGGYTFERIADMTRTRPVYHYKLRTDAAGA